MSESFYEKVHYESKGTTPMPAISMVRKENNI